MRLALLARTAPARFGWEGLKLDLVMELGFGINLLSWTGGLLMTGSRESGCG